MGKVLSYMHYRPMLSLSAKTFPRYLWGFMLQLADVSKNRIRRSVKQGDRTELPGGSYLSDGWESYLIERTIRKYGPFVPVK
jgi:hypothetical protein